MKRRLGMLIILALGLAACAGQAVPVAPDSGLSAPAVLRLAIGQEPATLDPQRTSEQSAIEVLSFACDTLLVASPERDGLLRGGLAESWQGQADGGALTVTLRPGLTFHNGDPLTAQSVRQSFERLQQPASNASPIYEDFQGVAMASPDERTIVFTLAEADANFADTLANPYAAVLNAAAAARDEQSFARQPICAGPYQIEEWQPAQYVLLRRNPAYSWAPAFYANSGPALIDQINMYFVSENDIRYTMLLNGELDAMSLSTPEQVTAIAGDLDMFAMHAAWLNGVTFVGFNYQRSPTDELPVRQALAHAVDKQGIVDALLKGLAEPAVSPLSPNIFGFDESLKADNYGYDVQAGRDLLSQAGFKDSDGDGVVERDGKPLVLRLLTTTSTVYGKIVVLLQDSFKQLGVEIIVQAVETADIARITPTGDFDILLYHYSWGNPDALKLFLGTERIGASNRVAYSNPAVDALLEQAAQTAAGSSAQQDLLLQAQRLILKDCPWQPLLSRKIVVATNNRVQNIRFTPSGELLWHDAVIK
jgi:peptide/nickel transport system substrate-binding protein